MYLRLLRTSVFCVSLVGGVFSFGLAHAEVSIKGKSMNPDISANFLGLWQQGTGISNTRTTTSHNGFSLQEAELQLTSDVDPYFRASVLFAISQTAGSTEFGIEPEEVFVETLSLPSFTVRAGKFKMALGKHNMLHTHAFPFIDAPLIHERLLGGEGLNEVGVSAAALVPTPWYSEFTAQVFNPSNETFYGSSSSSSLGTVFHWKNLWDLSDALTLEVGLSGSHGKTAADQSAHLWGSDITLKWRPSEGGKYHALIWTTEYLDGTHAELATTTSGDAQNRLNGIATWIQWQFAERWWLQGRYEHLGLSENFAIPSENRESLLLGYFPSEFSGLRLQYDLLSTQNKLKDDHRIALQAVFSIGAHPAHAY